MSTKSKFFNGILTFFDHLTLETVQPMAPVMFQDDFLYKTLNVTDYWTAIDVSAAGNTTPAVVADGANGVARLPLDVTSEAQESGLTCGDQRCFILNQGLIWEAKVTLSTLPTLLGIAVWGMAGDKNAVANTVAESAWFRADGSGAITVETDDTVNEQTLISTGVTVLTTDMKIYKIDFTVITDVKFYIDAVYRMRGIPYSTSSIAYFCWCRVGNERFDMQLLDVSVDKDSSGRAVAKSYHLRFGLPRDSAGIFPSSATDVETSLGVICETSNQAFTLTEYQISIRAMRQIRKDLKALQ